MWLEEVVRQVWNFPADMGIERWIRKDHPELGPLQEAALRGQIEDNQKALSFEVKEMSPGRVYESANTMNAAYARYVSHLLGSRNLFAPYRRIGYGAIGRRMEDEIWDTEVKGYYSDVEEAQKWAGPLGINDWFEWRALDQIEAPFGCS